MNKHQIKKLNMYEVILQFLQESDGDTLAKMPNFGTFLSGFEGTVDSIKHEGAIQVMQIEGTAAGKAALRVLATEKALKVVGAVKAYALFNNDQPLFARAQYSQTQLSRFPDSVVVLHFRDIEKLGLEHVKSLEPYHVNGAVMQEYAASIVAFDSYIPNPRKDVVTRMGATKKLLQLFEVADEQLLNMDVLTEVIADQHGEFCQSYRNSRIIIDAGYRKLPIRGFVTDTDGLPLEKVTVLIKGLKRRRKTTAKGQFRVMHLPAGVYEVVLQKNGYRDVSVSVAVTETMRTDLKLVMERLE